MPEQASTDVLVAGSGASGLMAAYRAQQSGAHVLLLTGSGGASARISSLNCALGYAANDTPADLAQDMLRAGGDVNNRALLGALTHRIGTEIRHLAALGVPFEHSADGRLARRQATGSSWTRAVYTQQMVGADVCRCVLAEIGRQEGRPVSVVKGGVLVDLDITDDQITGALAYDRRRRSYLRVSAGAVVLATGGAGHLFGGTTNPRGSQAAGYALALEAGAELVDMEFVSFEPFVLSAPPEARGQNLPTTVLRSGARLLNGAEAEFLDTASAPTKDVICRAMLHEIRAGRGTESGSVYFDLRSVPPAVIQQYPHLIKALKARPGRLGPGVLEIFPAQHYMDGGVRIDATLATSVPGLYAVGEVSGGAHGANRLAGAGGLEAVAGGALAGEAAAEHARGTPRGQRDQRQRARDWAIQPDAAALARIHRALDSGCGILRSGPELARSVAAIQDTLARAQDGHGGRPTRRTALVALAVARSALAREDSRGDHFRTDWPDRDDTKWLGNIVVSLGDVADLTVRFEPAGSLARPAHVHS
jgi:succinate dehydrogenase/fumarate reductase flavoprotein subunit